MANLLDLGSVFGEKIRGRFVQSSLMSKELQSKLFSISNNIFLVALALQHTKDAEQKLKLEAAKRRSQVFEAPMRLNSEPDLKKMRLM
jgi:hypothetical protein